MKNIHPIRKSRVFFLDRNEKKEKHGTKKQAVLW